MELCQIYEYRYTHYAESPCGPILHIEQDDLDEIPNFEGIPCYRFRKHRCATIGKCLPIVHEIIESRTSYILDKK